MAGFNLKKQFGIYLLLKNLNSEKNPHGITSIRMIQLYKNAIVEFLKVLFLSFLEDHTYFKLQNLGC